MSDARRRQYMRLKAEVLRLRLMQANLVASGTKQTMVERLLSHKSSQQDAARSHSPTDSDQSGSDVPVTPEPLAEHSPSLVRGHRHQETAPGSSRRHARSCSSRCRSRTPCPKRRYHGRSGSGSSSSSSSGQREQQFLLVKVAAQTSPPSPPSFQQPRGLLGSPVPLLHVHPSQIQYLVRRIRRGKFVNFDELLGPAMGEGTGAILGQKKWEKEKGAGRRRVVDLATWLEAWNIFLAVRIQIAPDSALALVKYQAIMTMLFSSYPAGVCLKYDSTFRQAVARDHSYLTPWDQAKEDILVWCASCNPFRGPKQFPPGPGSSNARPAPAGPTGSQSAGRATHTSSGQEI